MRTGEKIKQARGQSVRASDEPAALAHASDHGPMRHPVVSLSWPSLFRRAHSSGYTHADAGISIRRSP